MLLRGIVVAVFHGTDRVAEESLRVEFGPACRADACLERRPQTAELGPPSPYFEERAREVDPQKLPKRLVLDALSDLYRRELTTSTAGG